MGTLEVGVELDRRGEGTLEVVEVGGGQGTLEVEIPRDRR